MEKGFKVIIGVLVILIVGVILIIFLGDKEDKILVESNGDGSVTEESCEERCGIDNACIARCEAAIINLAMDTGSGCDMLTGDSKIDCEDSLYFKQARDGLDTSKCESMSDSVKVQGCKDSVLLLKVLDTGDKSLCNSIGDSGTKEMCLAV